MRSTGSQRGSAGLVPRYSLETSAKTENDPAPYNRLNSSTENLFTSSAKAMAGTMRSGSAARQRVTSGKSPEAMACRTLYLRSIAMLSRIKASSVADAWIGLVQAMSFEGWNGARGSSGR
jgi:hypothetical protein